MIDCGEVIRELLMENPACLLYLESENQQNIWGFKKTITKGENYF